MFLIITFIVFGDSGNIHGQITTHVTKYGTINTQRTFKNIQVLSGSSFKLPFPDCLQRKCITKSTTCCGFGFAAGKVVPPSGCIAYNDACKLVFVQDNEASGI
ncbi:unnamed protein product, partial [Rotaria sp. Silwood2]